MSAHRARRLATVLAGGALAMTAVSLVLMVPISAGTSLRDLGFDGVGGIMLGAIYSILGWLIATRRPENRIGWLFLAIGLSQAASGFMKEYAVYGLIIKPGALPFAELASWVGTWVWVPGYILVFVTILLFPDGRLPSRRWRPVSWLAWIAAGLVIVPSAVAAWAYRGVALLSDSEPEPGNDALMTIYVASSAIGQVLIILVGLAAVGAVAARFRRTNSIERQQIKWLAVAAIVEVSFLIVMGFATLPFPFDVISAVLVTPLVPIAIGVAILRYRLYEIDRIVSRTIGWAIVTGVLVAVFAGLVVALQAVLAPLTNENTLAVAGSTLIAATLFQPLRRRVQRAVDRRFNRAGYDAQRTTATFGESLRHDTDIGAAHGALVATAVAAVQPATAAVWLRGTMQ